MEQYATNADIRIVCLIVLLDVQSYILALRIRRLAG